MNKKCFLFLITCTILFVTCNSDYSLTKETVEFELESSRTLYWNEQAEIKVNIEGVHKVKWFINGIETSSTGNKLAINTGTEEKRFTVVAIAETDNKSFVSNPVVIYNTKNIELLRICYDFIDKYDIKTAISVCVKNDNLEFIFYDGMSSVQEQTYCSSSSLYYYYSITKTFVSALTLKLAEDNILMLDKRIDEYLDFSELNSNLLNSDATIRQLLSHTSGICDYTSNYLIFLNNPFVDNDWDPSLIFNFITSKAKSPGSFVYSTANYVLLGMIIERVMNKDLNILIREKLLLPLNIQNVYLYPQDNVVFDRVAHPHVLPNTELYYGNGSEPYDITKLLQNSCLDLLGKSTWAGGGMIGDAVSGAKWVYELFSMNGNESFDVIRKQIYASTENCYSGCAESDSFGLCGRRIFYKDTFFVGSYGRSVGSNNLAFYNKDKDTGFCILNCCNSDKSGNPDVYELLCKLYENL